MPSRLQDPGLVAIKTVMDKTRPGGRDDDAVRNRSDIYVNANPDKFTAYQNMSIEECVAVVDQARVDGDETLEWVMEAWVRHKFAPQNIGGKYDPILRTPKGQ